MSKWEILDSLKIRDLIEDETFKLPDGNMKKIGGDIHPTVDIDPDSPDFGEVHSTMRLPGKKVYHF